jgi:hypothetical protein
MAADGLEESWTECAQVKGAARHHGANAVDGVGGGRTFHAGDTIRVELLAQDIPYERPALTPFTVTVSDVTIELPSHDPPDGGEIVTPALAR